ncbi:MAB_1171c family putative transporter [Microbacterium istanbulense]|uniref:MAB_1171c family putative transporter n=1 Tax=Microbacterium istanbulense TaxID=3122049 RepID=A0ABU8LNN5_9MICO
MIQTLVATLMWALVASLLVFRRKRADRSVTYAAIAIAIAMTLNVDAIYTAIDPLLGETNIATLVADALLMTGLFFLGRGVMHTGHYRPQLVRVAVSLPILLVSLAAITVAFFFIDHGETTTRFMADLGDQLATAVYSIINFVYCGVVIATMMVLATRQHRSSTGIQRLPAALLTLGSAFGVALCLAVIVMDIAHVTGQLDLMYAVQPAYGPLSLLTFGFLCAGFTAQPVVRLAQHHARRRRTAALAAGLEPVWERATRVRPGLSQAEPLAAQADDPDGRLHRKIVEIRDAMIDGRVTFTISDDERALLQAAERHLLGEQDTETEPGRGGDDDTAQADEECPA